MPTVTAGAAMAGAATLDLHSTFACAGCVERNPLAALLHDPRRPAILYAGNYLLVAGLTMATHELRQKKSPFWWVPAALTTTLYLYSWQHNVRVVP